MLDVANVTEAKPILLVDFLANEIVARNGIEPVERCVLVPRAPPVPRVAAIVLEALEAPLILVFLTFVSFQLVLVLQLLRVVLGIGNAPGLPVFCRPVVFGLLS